MQLLVLDSTTKTIKAVLGEAATTQPVYVTTWGDSTATDVTPGGSDGALNSTTDVTIVAAPGASTQRIVKDISIYNGDGISHTLTIKYDNNGTQRILWTGTVTSGSSFYLSRVLSAGGGSPLTTKGDLYVYGTGNTRLPIGTDGYVLVADSTQSTGLKWAQAGTAFWTAVTLSYASSTSLTATGVDLTSYMKKGVVIKGTDSGGSTLKLWCVDSSSYSGGNTTINVKGSTAASGDTNFKYCLVKAYKIFGATSGTLATGTGNIFFIDRPEADFYPIMVEGFVDSAGTTNATTFDLKDDGTTIMATSTTISIASGATSGGPYSCNAPTTAIAAGSVMSGDITGVSTTPPVGGAIKLYGIPVDLVNRA